jgi:Putative zinc-finger
VRPTPPPCPRGGLPDERLSAFVDGDLPAVDLANIRRHFEECPACVGRADELAALARAARTLDAPEPPPTLWSAIEGALDERPWWQLGWRAFGVGALAGAAAVALIFFGVSGVSALRQSPSVAAVVSPAIEAARPAAVDPLLIEAEAEFARAAAAYERSIEKLRGLIAREETAWSPDARARYADRLARLDEAIARTREAARRTPADSVGHEQLFAAYQQKITFLAAAVQRGGGASPAEWPGGAP